MFEPNAVDKYLRINPQSKMLEPVWMQRDILPYALMPDASIITPGNAIIISTTDPVITPYKLPHSSVGADESVGNPLQIDQITNFNSANSYRSNLTIFIVDQGDQRQFMNFPCHIQTVSGTGQLSARLAEPLFLPTRHQLMVTLQKTAGAASENMRLAFFGKIYDTWSSNLAGHTADYAEMIKLVNRWLERRKYVHPYWMTTDNGVVSVPANQTVEVDSLVGSEGHFEATHILRPFVSGSATATPFEVEIINSQNKQSLMNGRIHSYMIGDGLNPQPFPCSFVVPAGTILRWRITDLSGSTNSVFLTLRGRKFRCPFTDVGEIKRQYGIPSVLTGAPKAPKNRTLEMQGA